MENGLAYCHRTASLPHSACVRACALASWFFRHTVAIAGMRYCESLKKKKIISTFDLLTELLFLISVFTPVFCLQIKDPLQVEVVQLCDAAVSSPGPLMSDNHRGDSTSHSCLWIKPLDCYSLPVGTVHWKSEKLVIRETFQSLSKAGILIHPIFGTFFLSFFQKQRSPFVIEHTVTLLLARPTHPDKFALPRCASRSADESLIHAKLVHVVTV